jgi:hypothetical protein
MIILDENITDDQRLLLRSWNIAARKIGKEVGAKGIADEAIIPLLHQLPRPTFFTCDGDFDQLSLCHLEFCIVYLAVDWREAAIFVRRLLRHPLCNTFAQRQGKVLRVSHAGIHAWRIREPHEEVIPWRE